VFRHTIYNLFGEILVFYNELMGTQMIRYN
jgi:hypothetical protein